MALLIEDTGVIKPRLTSIDTRLGLVHTDMANLPNAMDRLELRMERVENRLNFGEQQQYPPFLSGSSTPQERRAGYCPPLGERQRGGLSCLEEFRPALLSLSGPLKINALRGSARPSKRLPF